MYLQRSESKVIKIANFLAFIAKCLILNNSFNIKYIIYS